MMGTGSFAVPTFRRLIESRHNVVALVTQPQRPARGRRERPRQAMRDLAVEQQVSVLDPDNINTDDGRAALRRFKPDLLVVADYGQILRDETIAVAPKGAINLHGSLLPRYRGAAPVNWAIYQGDTTTGVTVFQLVPQVDAGPILAQRELAIEPQETAGQLKERLAELGGPLVVEVVDAMEQGQIKPIEQSSEQASRAPRLKKSDGLINWNRDAEAIANHVRAMKPWPGTFTFWHRPGGEPVRLGIHQVAIDSTAAVAAEPGTILESSSNGLIIATAAGTIAVESVQPAGKRKLSVDEFLRGYPLQAGHRLGPPPAEQL